MIITCEMVVPEEDYNNPTDSVTNLELGIETPALVFLPNNLSISTGSPISLEIYALEFVNVMGVHVQVSYDENRLSLTSVTVGEFFSSAIDPLFFYDNNSTSGTLNIYTTFLGDNESASGTGTLAYLVFNSTAPGQSLVAYGSESKMVDVDDNPIQLNGLGEGVISAQ